MGNRNSGRVPMATIELNESRLAKLETETGLNPKEITRLRDEFLVSLNALITFLCLSNFRLTVYVVLLHVLSVIVRRENWTKISSKASTRNYFQPEAPKSFVKYVLPPTTKINLVL